MYWTLFVFFCIFFEMDFFLFIIRFYKRQNETFSIYFKRKFVFMFFFSLSLWCIIFWSSHKFWLAFHRHMITFIWDKNARESDKRSAYCVISLYWFENDFLCIYLYVFFYMLRFSSIIIISYVTLTGHYSQIHSFYHRNRKYASVQRCVCVYIFYLNFFH